MPEEAVIIINGRMLTEEESTIMRMSVEALAAVMAQGIAERDERVMHAMSESYNVALAAVQRMLKVSSARSIH